MPDKRLDGDGLTLTLQHIKEIYDIPDTNEWIKSILLNGFVDGTKTISEDGTLIVSTSSDGMSLTKTFASDFSSVTTVLKSALNAVIAQSVKTFDASGRVITTEVIIY